MEVNCLKVSGVFRALATMPKTIKVASHMFVRPSGSMEQLGYYWTDLHEI
jgi:hypothetical protein